MELTKQDINVILNMLDDIDLTWGLTPEELKLKERIKRWNTVKNQNVLIYKIMEQKND